MTSSSKIRSDFFDRNRDEEKFKKILCVVMINASLPRFFSRD
jgi:hypothetical protein